jgi:hypothetical protein
LGCREAWVPIVAHLHVGVGVIAVLAERHSVFVLIDGLGCLHVRIVEHLLLPTRHERARRQEKR